MQFGIGNQMGFKTLKRFNTSQINTTQNIESEKVDLEKINDSLKKGDKTALQELQKLGIPYVLESNGNNYIVKYSYKGKNYEISYNEPTDSNNSETNNTNETNNNKLSNWLDKNYNFEIATLKKKTYKQSIKPDYTSVIDFSQVPNADATLDSLYNKDAWQLGVKMANSKLDSGYYDKIFEYASEIKQQVLSYIEDLCKKQGTVFNKIKVEQDFNRILSNFVKTMSPERTLKDLLNRVISELEKRHSLDTNKDGVVDENDKKVLVLNTSGIATKGTYTDPILMQTAAYFLTEDEKKLKEVMNFADESNTLKVKDKNKALEYLDIYETHVYNVVKKSHPELSEDIISRIIEVSKNIIIAENLQPDSEGFYNVSEALRQFFDRSTKAANTVIRK